MECTVKKDTEWESTPKPNRNAPFDRRRPPVSSKFGALSPIIVGGLKINPNDVSEHDSGCGSSIQSNASDTVSDAIPFCSHEDAGEDGMIPQISHPPSSVVQQDSQQGATCSSTDSSLDIDLDVYSGSVPPDDVEMTQNEVSDEDGMIPQISHPPSAVVQQDSQQSATCSSTDSSLDIDLDVYSGSVPPDDVEMTENEDQYSSDSEQPRINKSEAILPTHEDERQQEMNVNTGLLCTLEVQHNGNPGQENLNTPQQQVAARRTPSAQFVFNNCNITNIHMK